MPNPPKPIRVVQYPLGSAWLLLLKIDKQKEDNYQGKFATPSINLHEPALIVHHLKIQHNDATKEWQRITMSLT